MVQPYYVHSGNVDLRIVAVDVVDVVEIDAVEIVVVVEVEVVEGVQRC